MSLGNKEIMAKNIQFYMNKKGLDRNRLCADLNLKYMTVSDWLNAKTYPRIDKIEMLANYFNVNKSDLVEERDEGISTLQQIIAISSKLEHPRQNNVLAYANEQLEEQSSNYIKEDNVLYEVVVTEAVAAGRGYSYGEDETEICYTNKELPRYDIASYIEGDSMEPEYHDGDVVLIRREMYSSPDVYVVDYDGKSYLKKVYKEKDHFRLVSFNKEYEDIIIKIPIDDDIYFNIVGKVVGSFTPEGR